MPRIGQILSESVPLSAHDLEEILQEQKTTRQRFGDAALALGKVRPDQVWAAWLSQLVGGQIDLDRTPADPQAIDAVPSHLIHTHRMFPVRLRGSDLVLAVSHDVTPEVLHDLEHRTGLHVFAVRTCPDAIDRAIARNQSAVAA